MTNGEHKHGAEETERRNAMIRVQVDLFGESVAIFTAPVLVPDLTEPLQSRMVNVTIVTQTSGSSGIELSVEADHLVRIAESLRRQA
jgi:hypothetical protein